MPANTIDARAEAKLLEQIRKSKQGTGCLHCTTGSCYVGFDGRHAEIMETRKELRSLDPSEQELQILLMFAHPASLESRSNFGALGHERTEYDTSESSECASQGSVFHTSEESAAEGEQVQEQFATSDEEDKEAHRVEVDASLHRPQKRIRYPQRRRERYSCSLLGTAVCRGAAASLLGISKQMVKRIVSGGRDLRKGPRPRGKWGESMKMRKDGKFNGVLNFFLHLYHSCAEGLPNKLKFARSEEGGICIDPRPDKATTFSLAADKEGQATSDEDLQCHVIDNSSDEERVLHGTALYLSQPRTVESMLHGGVTERLPRRYLPHGRPIHLFWQYVQVSRNDGQPPASYATFLRVLHTVFDTRHGFLKFRKSGGDHAKCTTCECYKKELKAARSVKVREEIMKDRLLIETIAWK